MNSKFINPHSLLFRGTLLKCSHPGCDKTSIVVHKAELPVGWLITSYQEAGKGQVIEIHCPEHDPVMEFEQ